MVGRTRLLIALILVGCGASAGINTSRPFVEPTPFASRIKRFRVRVTEPMVVVELGPRYREGGGKPTSAPTLHHDGVPEAIKRVLEAKGYEVAFVWDDVWSYGRLRPCLLEKQEFEIPEDRRNPPRLKAITPDPEAG